MNVKSFLTRPLIGRFRTWHYWAAVAALYGLASFALLIVLAPWAATGTRHANVRLADHGAEGQIEAGLPPIEVSDSLRNLAKRAEQEKKEADVRKDWANADSPAPAAPVRPRKDWANAVKPAEQGKKDANGLRNRADAPKTDVQQGEVKEKEKGVTRLPLVDFPQTASPKSAS